MANVFQEDQEEQMPKSLRRRERQLEDPGSESEQDYNIDTVADEDDEEIDSDEAFNEEDEQLYESFKFSGSTKKEDKQSSKTKATSKQKRKEINLNEDMNGSQGSSDKEYEDGEDYMDISDMLGSGSASAGTKQPSTKIASDDDDDVEGSNDDEDTSEDEDADSQEDSAADDSDDVDDEEVEDFDESKLDQLDNFIDGLSRKRKADDEASTIRKRYIPERTEAYNESEFNLTARDREGNVSKLGFEDMFKSLEGANELSDVRKTLQDLEKGGRKGKHQQPLSAPLSKRMQDRIDREAAYEETKAEVTKWQPTIKKNREADHLVFPMNEEKLVASSNNVLAADHQPTTELEKKIDGILRQSGVKEADIAEEEELALNKLTPEEVEARRKELRLMRSLMFREEEKAKRVAKIKSKTYRKIHKKERERTKLGMDALMELDPEQAEREQLKAEQARAKERMTMRHKNTGKWAKQMKRFGDAEEGSQQAITEQLQRGEDLRRKIQGMSEDDSDRSVSDEEELLAVDAKATAMLQLQELEAEEEKPVAKGVFAMKFMQDAMQRQKRDTQKAVDDFVEELEEGDVDQEANVSSAPTARKGIMSFGAASSGAPVDENDDDPVAIKQTSKVVKTSGPMSIDGRKPKHVGKKASDASETLVEGRADGITNPWLAAVEDAVNNQGTRSDSATKSKDKASKAATKLKKRQKASAAAAEEVMIDTNKVITSKVVGNGIVLGGGESDDEDEEVDPTSQMQHKAKTTLSQRELVKAAFANDDVVNEFEVEKQRVIDEDAPKDEDIFLPGWGSWGGKGAKKSKSKKPIIKHTPGIDASKRKDAKLAHVIINEKKDKKAAKYLTDRVPHPFESWAQYERTLSAPIGGEWNTRATFQAATKPRVISKIGKVIEPLSVRVASDNSK